LPSPGRKKGFKYAPFNLIHAKKSAEVKEPEKKEVQKAWRRNCHSIQQEKALPHKVRLLQEKSLRGPKGKALRNRKASQDQEKAFPPVWRKPLPKVLKGSYKNQVPNKMMELLC